MKGTLEEMEAGYKSCISYYGSYKLDAEGDFAAQLAVFTGLYG